MKRAFAFASVLALASAVRAAAPELRGVWVTTTGFSLTPSQTTGDIKNPALAATNFANLRSIGINTIYMDALRNGDTWFKSNAMKAITGRELALELTNSGPNGVPAPRGDLFAETLIQSHRNGMAQIAWLQYGFATQYQPASVNGKPVGNALTNYMANKGWLLKNSVGTGAAWDSTNNFAWMNPLVPEVRKLIIDMGVELVTKYDVDGVEFDDRLAWPTAFGFNDPTIKAAFEADATGNVMPTSPTSASFGKFTTWRAKKITEFGQEFSAAIRKANPNAIVAAAPGGYGDALSKYAVDMPAWSRSTVTVNGVTTPTFDEITPQIYNSNPGGTNFSNLFNADLNAMDQSHLEDYGVGIALTSNGTTAYNWDSVSLPQVNAQRARTGTKGHIWWYSPGVFLDKTQLTAYYDVAANGQARRPDQPDGWRPAPLVTTAAGTGLWDVTTSTLAERYQVIARTGDTWTIVLNTVLPAGTLTLNTGGTYAAVEVLVDRRGFIAGDANFDRAVNFDDLAVLAQNYNLSGKLWTQGDFTLDGVVNFDDLVILAQRYNTGVPSAQVAVNAEFASDWALAQGLVPEPGTMSLAVIATATLSRRRNRASDA